MTDKSTMSNKGTKAEVQGRRATVFEMVVQKLESLEKPITHTALFHEVFPDSPEGKESVQKWNDIGRALTSLVNEGKVLAQKPEGKRRTTFALVREG